MKFYKDTTTNAWMKDEGIISPSLCLLEVDEYSDFVSLKNMNTNEVYFALNATDIEKENGTKYASKADFKSTVAGFFVKPAGGIESGQEVIDALGYTPADEADLNTETTARQNADNALESQISSAVSGLLGFINHSADAPTPAKSGYYIFNTAGVCSWLSSQVVKAQDQVFVAYTAPSTYTYTYMDTPLSDITSYIVIDDSGSLNIIDDYGNVGLILDVTGKLITKKAQIDEITVSNLLGLQNIPFTSYSIKDNDDAPLIITDELGYKLYEQKLDGTIIKVNNTKKNFNSIADINYIISFGQSLSGGSWAVPSLSTTKKYNNLMFVGGVRFYENTILTTESEQLASFVDLVENDDIEGAGETPISGMCQKITECIKNDFGIDYTEHEYLLLGSAPGQGNRSIDDLDKGSIYYTRLIHSVTAGLNNSQAINKTFNTPCIAWTQGENDFSQTQSYYKGKLLQLYSDLNTDIKAITGQSNDIIMPTYQPVSNLVYGGSHYPNIALALLDLCLHNQGFYMACPLYFLKSSDGTHLTNDTSKIYGAYLGLVYEKVILKGEDHKPIYPISNFIQGKILEVKFHVPQAPLVIDESFLPNPGNYGFNLYNSSGVEKTITSVTVVRPDTVRIVCSTNVVATDKLTYAINGTGSGFTASPRGNLRDSQGETIVFDPQNVNYKMHNWTPIFEYTIV